MAQGGWWNGARAMGSDWLRDHGGGNDSLMNGDSEMQTSFGVVTVEGTTRPLPGEVFADC